MECAKSTAFGAKRHRSSKYVLCFPQPLYTTCNVDGIQGCNTSVTVNIKQLSMWNIVSLIQVIFPSSHGLETFLNAKDRVEVDLATLFSQHLSQSAAEPCLLSCEVETELFLVAPDDEQKDARVISVSSDNCSECLSILKDSSVFEFGPLFRAYHHTPDRALSKGSYKKRPLPGFCFYLPLALSLSVPPSLYLQSFCCGRHAQLTLASPSLFHSSIISYNYTCQQSSCLLLSPDRLTLLELVSELTIVVDWFHLGLYLGVPEHELLCIEQYQRGHVQQCRTDMLTWWLQRGVQPTWTRVVRALEGIKMEPLARKIATKYGRLIASSSIRIP